jgi:ATP-binding cassette, subfamily F, member 3
VILSKVNLRLDPDDRIAIVGANGQGKTTLVKSIAERLPLMAGKRVTPKAVRIGYFSQDQLDELTEGDTVLDHVRRLLPNDTTPAKVRAAAAAMGFNAEKVEKLSGGEKVRLLLGLMSQSAPHILILDEPTSHLDIDSREALIYALNDFPGAVLLITHDIYLAEATADRLWLVKDGRATTYDGDLADYRALVMKADRAEAKDAKPVKKSEPKPAASPEDKAVSRLTNLPNSSKTAPPTPKPPPTPNTPGSKRPKRWKARPRTKAGWISGTDCRPYPCHCTCRTRWSIRPAPSSHRAG